MLNNHPSGSSGASGREMARSAQDKLAQFARQFSDDPEGLRLHHDLCNPAIAEAASQCRVVWAQVKGYPYWPAQILLPKEAKTRFRDTAQEYSEKRMASHRPVHFFVTREISWVLSKQVKSWAQGVADGCHTKNRMNGTFRDSLMQVSDLLYGRRAPSGFTKPSQLCKLRPAPSPTRGAPAARPPDPPSSPNATSAPSPADVVPDDDRANATRSRAHGSTEHFAEAEELERSRNAILGGMSRDERHRHREEVKRSATEAAVRASPSATVSYQLSGGTHATPVANAQAQSRAPGDPQSLSAGANGGLSGGDTDATPSVVQFGRGVAGEVAVKRHTRSQGIAELGVSDLRNLEPRKVPRRAASSAPHMTMSGMGSRGTGDGATGRPPAETPRSVGTAPFADARPTYRLGDAGLPRSPGSMAFRPPGTSTGEVEPRQSDGLQGIVESAVSGSPGRAAGLGGSKAVNVGVNEGANEGASMECVVQHAEGTCNRTESSDVQVRAEASVCMSTVETSAPGLVAGSTMTGEGQEVKTSPKPSPQPSPQASPPGSPKVAAGAEVMRQAPSPKRWQVEAVEAAAAVALGTLQQAPVYDPSLEKHGSSCLKAQAPNGVVECVTAGRADSDSREGSRDISLRQYVRRTSSTQEAPQGEGRKRGAAEDQGNEGEGASARQRPRNGMTLSMQGVSSAAAVSLATQNEEMNDGGHVAGQDDDDTDEEAEVAIGAAVKRPRRAATRRKTALELVNGEAARGGQKSASERHGNRTSDGYKGAGSRMGHGAAAAGTAALGAGSRRRSLRSSAEPQPVLRRTRSSAGPGSTTAVPAADPNATAVAAVRAGSPSPELQASAMLTLTAAAAAAGPGDWRRLTQQAVMEQLQALQGQPQTQETLRLQRQLQATAQNWTGQLPLEFGGFVRSGGGIGFTPDVSTPVVAPAPPSDPAALAASIRSLFSRGNSVSELPLTEFSLPHEYLLMRSSQHQHADVNKYPPPLKPKKLRKDIPICGCTRHEEFKRSDTYCCGSGCLNRLANILCDPRSCPCRGDCQNKPFNLRRHPAVEIRLTESRGKGLFAKEHIGRGQFLVEYTGEVINEAERLARMLRAQKNGVLHFYIMELSPGLYMDAADVGSNARFMNSSCSPNCETQKWKDASTGETRIGLFTNQDVLPGQELTYDYHFQHDGLQTAAQGFRCMCGSANCRGTMDQNPDRMRDAGRRVRIKWDDDHKWYEGFVLRYHPGTGKHTIYYPVDGDAAGTQETLLLDVVEHEWMDDAAGLGAEPSGGVAAAGPSSGPVLSERAGRAGETGPPPGQAAVQATRERERKATMEPGEAAMQGQVAAAAGMGLKLEPGGAGVLGSGAIQPVAGSPEQRVPLPRPLPTGPNDNAVAAAEEPVIEQAATPSNGLDLLSSVAASLPDRAATPPLTLGGAMGSSPPAAGAAPALAHGLGTVISATGAPVVASAAPAAAPLQMPMFAVLAMLPPRLTDGVQLAGPLPAADPSSPRRNTTATPSTAAPQLQDSMQAILDAAAQHQAIRSPANSPATQSALPYGSAQLPNHDGTPQQPQQPPEHQPHTLRAVSPNSTSQQQQVITQATHSSSAPPAAVAGFPIPAAASPSPGPPPQQGHPVTQAPAQPTQATQQPAMQTQPQQPQLQLLAAANWPQQTQQGLAASMQAMIQQMFAGVMQQQVKQQQGLNARPDLALQQTQHALHMGASLPIQAPQQPYVFQHPPFDPPTCANSAHNALDSLAAAATHCQTPQQVAAPVPQHLQQPPQPHPAAISQPHLSSNAGFVPAIPDSHTTHHAAAAGTQLPLPTAAAAGGDAALRTDSRSPFPLAPRSPSAGAASAEPSTRSLHQDTPAAPFSARPVSPTGTARSSHGPLQGPLAAQPMATPDLHNGTAQAPQGTSFVSSASEATRVVPGQSAVPWNARRSTPDPSGPVECAPHPMFFAEHFQRSTSGSGGASGGPALAAGATHAPQLTGPSAFPGSPAPGVAGTAAHTSPARAFTQHGEATALGMQAAAASLAADPSLSANLGSMHSSPPGILGGVRGPGGGEGAASDRGTHWLLALRADEETIRTWYRYATEHLKLTDPLQERHRGEFQQFRNELRKSMAIHQYMAQAAAPAAGGALRPPGAVHGGSGAGVPWPAAASAGQPSPAVAPAQQWSFQPH